LETIQHGFQGFSILMNIIYEKKEEK